MCIAARLGLSVAAVFVPMMLLPMTLFPQKTQSDALLSGIVDGKTRVADLSYAINDKFVPWPGDEKWFEAEKNATVENIGLVPRSIWLLENYRILHYSYTHYHQIKSHPDH